MTNANGRLLLPSIKHWLALSVVLGAAAGCGDRKGNVSGQVKYNGSPLPEGKITFFCEGGNQPTPSARIHDGRYEIKGVPVGPVKITVATYKPAPSAPLPPGVGPMRPPDSEGSPAPPLGKYVAIPPHYSQVDQSNLSYVVKPGDQEHPIDLEPRK